AARCATDAPAASYRPALRVAPERCHRERLSTPGEQQAMSHPVPGRDAADRLASLQGLFDKANLLVVTPSSPTLGAQHIDLHSPRDFKARLKAKSSRRLPNYTRRPRPEEYIRSADESDGRRYGRDQVQGNRPAIQIGTLV